MIFFRKKYISTSYADRNHLWFQMEKNKDPVIKKRFWKESKQESVLISIQKQRYLLMLSIHICIVYPALPEGQILEKETK